MRVALFCLLSLSSCTLLFGALSPSPCEEGEPPRCEGNTFVSCQQGFEVEQDCAPSICQQDSTGAFCQGDISPTCGDGVLDEGEACDDGNNEEGDGCDPSCLLEPPPDCGDAVLDQGEACDDGNNINGDGCEADCTLTPQPGCGNGVLEPPEECDDGNTLDGDSCEADCTFTCGSGLAADASAFDAQSGRCYLLFDNRVSWIFAEGDCNTIDGHLASITTSQENDLVRSILPNNDSWIGLSDIALEGVLTWVTGELLNFNDFLPGEPSDSENQDCVNFREDGWADETCSKELAYVCEIEPKP